MNAEIKVKASGIEYTDILRSLVEKKIPQLEKLLPKSATDPVFEIELGKATKHHKSGKIYRAEINVSYGSVVHRAEEIAVSIEEAFEVAKDELKGELTKQRGKSKVAIREGGRILKKMVRES